MKDLNMHKQNTNKLSSSLIPNQEEYSEDKIEDILEDLKSISKSDYSKELSTHLFRLMSSKYPVPDLTRLDTILRPFYSLLNEEMIDTLCIIVLKSINFNLEYFLHKMNIYEKQGIKSNRTKEDVPRTKFRTNEDVSRTKFRTKEDVSMPNFKKVLNVFLKRKRLSPELKSIRPFITYFILKDKLERSLSFEDIYKECLEGGSRLKGDDEGRCKECYDEGRLKECYEDGKLKESYEGGRNKVDDGLYEINYNDSKEECIKQPDSISSPFSYDGPYEVFYFLQYLLSGNVNVLKEWCLLIFEKEESLIENEGVEVNDNSILNLNIDNPNYIWSLLNLPPMPSFLLNELKYIKDTSVLYSIILQCKSHFILSKFLFKILHKLKFSRSFHILVLSSFHPKKVNDSLLLLKRLYKKNYYKTNRILRDLIVGFKPKGLEDLFFTSYLTLDLNYFECLKIYLKNIQLIPYLMPREKLKSLLESEYFNILIERKEDFCLILSVLNENNLLDLTLKIIKKYKWTPTYENIEKIKFLYKNYKIEKSLFVDEIKSMILKLSSINNGRCFEMISDRYKDGDCKEGENTKVGYAKRERINIHANEERINVHAKRERINIHTNQIRITQEKSTSITDSTSNPNSSTIFSLISNVSTIEDISKVDFYEKKFKIKKTKKDFNPENNKNVIKNLIDLVFIFRDETLKKSYLKKLYKLDPSHYLKNLKEGHLHEDVFFSRALRIALKQSRSKDEMIFWISEMPFYKKDDYWSVTLRRSIGLEEGVVREEGYDIRKGEEEGVVREEEEEVYDIRKGEERECDSKEPTITFPTKDINSTLNTSISTSTSITTLNTFYSNSTLRDSYLDLSQFNESKLIVESKKEIEKILNNCKPLSNPFLSISGLVMKYSSISISHRLNKFILVFKAYQLDLEGVQILLEMKGKEKSLKIGFINGKLFQETIKDNLKERKFIETDLKKERNNLIYLELISNGTKLKMNVNTKVYNIPFFKVDLVLFVGIDDKGEDGFKKDVKEEGVKSEGEKVITEGVHKEENYTPNQGKDKNKRDQNEHRKDHINKESLGEGSFKGIINKILLIEGCDYKHCRIVNLDGAYLYVKVLSKLERYLKYHNLFGVYLDSKTPYFFNKKVPIEFRNVFENR